VRAVAKPDGSTIPLVVCCFAAATDFADGRLARRRGPTGHGALLDGLADVTFVLAGTTTAVYLGLLPVAVPVAIAAAFATYLIAATRRQGNIRAARSTVGHTAGVFNYLLTGLVAVTVAWPHAPWSPILHAGAVIVTTLNLAAIALRTRRASS
jgi:phosphatidylglycerophosphate synthase